MSDPTPAALTEQTRLELEALFDQLRVAGRNDPAYCVAHAATVLLGAQAPRSLAGFAEQYHPSRPRRAATPLDESTWLSLLYHPDDDPYVGKVFESVLGPVRSARVQPIERFGLNLRDALNPAASSLAVVRALGGAAFALGVPTPLIFLKSDRPGGLGYVQSEPIASIAGGSLASGRSLEELAFAAGYHMAFYRADHYARVLYGSLNELTTLFLAALKVGWPDLLIPAAAAPVVPQLAALVDKDPSVDALVKKVVKLFVDRGEPVDIARWVRGTAHTALRAGLLLAGDLEAAGAITTQLADAPADAMSQLSAFAISEEYFELRQRTGIALWPDQAPARPSDAPRATVPEPTGGVAVTVPPPPDTAGVMQGAWDLRSVEISLDEFAAHAPPPAQDAAALRSVEIPVGELEGAPLARVDTAADPLAEGLLGSLATIEHPLASPLQGYLADKQTDRAFYVAAVWRRRDGVALTPAPVRDLFDRERARAAARPRGALTDAAWDEWLADPGEGTPVGRLLAALAPCVRAAQPRSPEDYGYERAQALSPASSPAAQALAAASEALAVAPPPLVFAVEDYPSGFARPPCDPVITLVNASRLAGATPAELAFLAGEHVAYFRAARHARVLARGPAVLTAVVRAVLDAFAAGQAPAAGDPFVAGVIDALARDAATLAVVRSLATTVRDHERVDEDVVAWCEATECTAARAGLLLSFDFDAAARALNRQRGAPTLVSPERKLAALEEFALSDRFARLRAMLGM